MKISYKWLSEYIDHQKSPETIAKLLTNTGLEVEEQETYSNLPPNLEELVVGEVKQVEQHPDADKLKVTQVDINQPDNLQIICGAPNVAEGQKVVVAPVGTTIKNMEGETLKIKKAKMRGVQSQGMIVSAHEIGLGHDQSGILVMDSQIPVGEAFLSQYGNRYEDQIFEVGLTPNRSDATSHIGVARDLSACLDKPIQYPDIGHFKVDNKKSPVTINLQEPNKCPRYSGLVIEGIQVQESPEWLQNKLKAVGLQPINNIVDLTNYVMLEWGHPLHAFDLERLQGNEIIIQSAPKGQGFNTLDGENRTLEGTELMICDVEKPIALAGIMGGENSGIQSDTKSLFLESAYFDPATIRRAAKRHQIMTDASFRFERGADPSITVEALKRAAILIKEVAGGTIVSEILDEYPEPIEPAVINLSYQYLDTLIGHALPREQVKTIVYRLGFSIDKETEEILTLKAPTYRVDVTRPVDVVEEIIRIYSLDAIAVNQSLKASLPTDNDLSDQSLQSKLARYLSGNGFFEAITPPFTSEKDAQQFPELASHNTVQIVNPLSQDQNRLRKLSLFNGLPAVQYNLNRDQSNIRLYEFGRVYWENADRIYEGNRLNLYLTGNYHEPSWYQEVTSIDFYYLKGIVRNLLHASGIKNWEIAEETQQAFAYNLTYYTQGRWVVDFGSIKPKILKNFDIEQEVFYANFDLDILNQANRLTKTTYKPISKFPAIDRDLSIVIPKSVTFRTIKDLIKNTEDQLLKDIRLFDVYQGDNIEEGYQSYAFRMVFQDDEKTLKDKEVDKIMTTIMQHLETKLGARIRR